MSHQTRDATQLLAELTVHDSRETIKRTLAAARELLGVEVAYLSRRSPLEGEPEHRPCDGQVVSVPLHFSDGSVHGTLECKSLEPSRPLTSRDVDFMHVLARVVSEQLEREQRELEQQRARNESAGLRALLAAVEARDDYTGEHCRGVVELSLVVAHELRLGARELEHVEQVALLHDVGKVAVPDSVLRKPGPLSTAERAVVERHTETGARIVRSIPGLAHLAPAIRAAHERWDGLGYPDGLSGERIPLASRITFVCDAYDAMTSDRPYRRALDERRARAELRANAGSQFCRRSASALLGALERLDGRERLAAQAS